jgi:hypothetical protein
LVVSPNQPPLGGIKVLPGGKNFHLMESYMYEVLNEVYLKNFSQMSATLCDESNAHK